MGAVFEAQPEPTPEPAPPPEPEPTPEPEEPTVAENEEKSGSATERELARMKEEAEARQKADEEAIEAQHAATEAFREEYENSDRGAVRRQIEEAEAAMRGPHPLEGFTVGDPTQGPST
jgi:hypothetical protein